MLIENIMLRGYLMHKIITFSKQALNESLDFLNMLRTSNSFAKSDTGVVVDRKPHPSQT